jgi:hypothetical protein
LLALSKRLNEILGQDQLSWAQALPAQDLPAQVEPAQLLPVQLVEAQEEPVHVPVAR